MSRAAILANVRSGLKVEARHEAERRASVEARLAQGAHHLVPARGSASPSSSRFSARRAPM